MEDRRRAGKVAALDHGDKYRDRIQIVAHRLVPYGIQ